MVADVWQQTFLLANLEVEVCFAYLFLQMKYFEYMSSDLQYVKKKYLLTACVCVSVLCL